MALVVKDRVRETTTTTGTGTVTLAGAMTGFQSFSAIGNGNTTYYTINLPGANEWEVGIGTYTSSGTTLSRDTVLASSNSGSLVSFSAGTKDVFCTYPAGRSVYYDTSTNVTLNALTLSGGTANGVLYLDGSKVATTGSALTFDGTSAFTVGGESPLIRIKDTVNPASTASLYLDAPSTTGFGGISANFPSDKLELIWNSAVRQSIGLDGTTIWNVAGSEAARLTSDGLEIKQSQLIGYSSYASIGTNGLAVAGNVGIGTSSPSVKLQVNVGTVLIETTASNSKAQLLLGSAGANYGQIQNDSTGVWSLGYGAGYSSLGTPVLTWNTSGNVGIGTSSPSAKLNAVGTGDTSGIFETTGTSNAASLIIRSGNGTTSGLYAYARFVNNDTNAQDWRIGTYGTNNLSIVNAKAGTTPVVLDSSGNLGLGGTNNLTGTRLYVQQVGETYSGGQSSYNSLFPSGYVQVLESRNVPSGTVGASLLVFSNTNSNGNTQAYIGTQSGNSDNAASTLVFGRKTSSTVWAESGRFSTDGTFRVKGAGTAGSTDAVQFSGSAPAQSLILDSSGNVGIGTSSPAYKLHVSATASTAGYFTSSGAVTTVDLDNTNANGWGSNIAIRTGGTAAGYFGTIGSLVGSTSQNIAIWATAGKSINFYTDNNSTAKATLDSSGNLGLGVTPSAWQSGGNLELPAAKVISFAGSSGSLVTNFYINSSGAATYTTSAAATSYFQTGGQHQWFTAPSGTAGNPISFTQAMTLDASGNLGIGTSSPAQKLTVNGDVSILAGKKLFLWNSTNTHTPAITSPSADVIAFLNNAGSQAMTLDASGNLGIGTSSPSYKLHVVGTTFSYGSQSQIWDGATGTYATFRYNGAAVGDLGTGNQAFSSGSTGDFGITSRSGNLVFGTNVTERARITSDGDLLVAQTTGDQSVQGIIFNPYGTGRFITNGGADNVCLYLNRIASDGAIQKFLRNNTEVGSVSVTTTATAYNTSSDYRLKDNQQPLTNSGAFIDALQPKTWNWKADGTKGVGFIAHEVQAVSPSSVVGEKDAVDEDGKPVHQSMEYGSAEFIANIIAELQSLRARVAQLEQGA